MKNGRKSFLETLTNLAEQDPKVILLIGDVGFSFIEEYKERFPNQFLNTGACEQTMMNVAVGLANEGWKPWVYTMRNFIVFRPAEQVRNNICFGNANVNLIGVSGSEAYAFLGMSHNVYDDEDIKIVKLWPNINVYKAETEQYIRDNMVVEHERIGPSYFVI